MHKLLVVIFVVIIPALCGIIAIDVTLGIGIPTRRHALILLAALVTATVLLLSSLMFALLGALVQR